MENASKALLIAAAILIAIVLITFGVIVLGQGSEIINNTSMSETEVTTFNAKFTGFQGEKVRGSKVNTLLNTVLQNNLAQDDDGMKVAIGSDGSQSDWLSTGASSLDKKADTGKVYKVECKYSDSGLIYYIKVTPEPAGS